MSDILIGNMDARVWADEFNKVLVSKGEQPYDPGWLIGWFANAIMAGHDRTAWDRDKAHELIGRLVGVLLESRPDKTWADPDYAAFYRRFNQWEKVREEALTEARAYLEKK